MSACGRHWAAALLLAVMPSASVKCLMLASRSATLSITCTSELSLAIHPFMFKACSCYLYGPDKG